MKKAVTYLAVIFTLLSASTISLSQCVIDSTQSGAGVYPDTLPNATAGQPYFQDVTFVMLTDTLGLTIYNYQIANVVGLPLGITWQCNNFANGCNYDPSVSLFGCVALSGTPIIPGMYTMTVTVIADVQLVGLQTIPFDVPFIVDPGTVSNPGFSMQNSLGCDPLTVDFVNNNPGQLSYLWDFGNSTQSTLENPGPVTYTTPGTYVVTQTVTPNVVPTWYLTNVTVTSIPNNYGGILDDPDMYFLLFDDMGVQVYDSHPSVSNTFPPVSWTAPNIPLSNINYTIHVWDEDGGLFGADDNLGEISFAGNGVSGSATATVSGASGTLTVEYTIFQPPVVPLVATDTIYVYATPAAPAITASGPLTFCENDSVNLSVADTVNQVQWFESGILVPGSTATNFTPTTSGNYTAQVTTVNGCTAMSAPVSVTINPLPTKPTFFVVGNVFTTGVTGVNLQWYFNGAPLSGATGNSITAAANGTYTLCATDANNCENCSDSLVYVGVGINEIASNGFQIYPNPSHGSFTVLFGTAATRQLTIADAVGRVVNVIDLQGDLSYVFPEKLAPGIYLIGVAENGQRSYTKLVVK